MITANLDLQQQYRGRLNVLALRNGPYTTCTSDRR